MDNAVALTAYKTSEVARMLGWSPSTVRSSVRHGYVHPDRGPRGEYLFSFQDLVALRAVKELRDSGLSPRKVATALDRLVESLPEEQTLAGVRIVADGDRVVVEDGDEIWNPESGQRVLDFYREGSGGPEVGAPAPLRRRAPAEAPEATGDPASDPAADEWYQVGLELESDDPAEAKAAYRKAIELAPDHVDAHLNLGRLLHEEGRVRTAAECYRQAAALRPTDPTACFNLAVALEDLDRPMEALTAYERAIELDSSYADAYYNIAGIYERLGKRAEATRYLKTYKRLTTG